MYRIKANGGEVTMRETESDGICRRTSRASAW
jgi:hypothetical protein